MKSILIVDDSHTVRKLVCKVLKDGDYRFDEAVDGVEALEMSRQKNYDLVITDEHMPNMKGLELIENLRKLDVYQATPIIVLSTDSDPTLRQKGRELGATGWIQKPLNPNTFDAIIESLLDAEPA